jgi:C1A family cysteine protease
MLRRDVKESKESGHAVALVDYIPEEGCFKAKNSWGKEFGDNGYFKIEKGLFVTFYDLYAEGLEEV